MTDYEVVQRIAERIWDHDIFDHPSQLWRCKNCGKYGQGQRDYAHHVAQEIVSDLGITAEMQWVPATATGEELAALPTFHDAEVVMQMEPNVVRVDREYRMVSRWIRPSRDG